MSDLRRDLGPTRPTSSINLSVDLLHCSDDVIGVEDRPSDDKDDVLRAAQRYLDPDKAILVIVGDVADLDSFQRKSNDVKPTD